MPQSRRAAIHGRYCNFSTGQGVRAKFEYYSATYHLPGSQHFHTAMTMLCDNGLFDLLKFTSLIIRSSAQSDKELADYCQQNIPGTFRMASVDVSPSRERSVHSIEDQKLSALLTAYAFLFETVDIMMSVNLSCQCNIPGLFLHESLQPLPGRLHILDGKEIRDKVDCIALSKVTRQREINSRNRRCLSFWVTRASVEISPTTKLTSILSGAGIGKIWVYILRRSTKCSIDWSRLASTSQLDTALLAVWFC